MPAYSVCISIQSLPQLCRHSASPDWTRSWLGLRGWWGDWSISPTRRGWGSWACSAWRREGCEGTLEMPTNICRVGVRRMGPDSVQWCPATGQGATGTNWSRGSSVWTWGRISSLWGWWSTGTGYPGKWWSLLLWRYSRPAWTRSSTTYCRWPCFGRRVGLDDPQRSLPTPTVLWFCDSSRATPAGLHCDVSSLFEGWTSKCPGDAHCLCGELAPGLRVEGASPARSSVWETQAQWGSGDTPVLCAQPVSTGPAWPTWLCNHQAQLKGRC